MKVLLRPTIFLTKVEHEKFQLSSLKMLMVFVSNLEETKSYNVDLINWTDDKVRLKHLFLH